MAKLRGPLERKLYELTLSHLAKLLDYVPGPVRRAGGSATALVRSYHGDPLFSIFGLDSTEYVAATLAGGTITSIHRKLGDIYESRVSAIFEHRLKLTPEELSYTANIVIDGETQQRSLDAYLQFDRIGAKHRVRVQRFAKQELAKLSQQPRISLVGIGMEVRHCYQTGDSKRAQADEHMARHLLVSGILPIVPFFCGQSNRSIVRRYRSICVVKEAMESYDMVKMLSGFDYYAFLQRHRAEFRQPIINMLRGLST